MGWGLVHLPLPTRPCPLSQQGDAGPDDGEKEKEQIRSLQEQLAALKELTVGGAMTL